MRDPNKMFVWSGKEKEPAQPQTTVSQELLEAARQRAIIREEAEKAEREFAERIKPLQKSI